MCCTLIKAGIILVVSVRAKTKKLPVRNSSNMCYRVELLSFFLFHLSYFCSFCLLVLPYYVVNKVEYIVNPVVRWWWHLTSDPDLSCRHVRHGLILYFYFFGGVPGAQSDDGDDDNSTTDSRAHKPAEKETRTPTGGCSIAGGCVGSGGSFTSTGSRRLTVTGRRLWCCVSIARWQRLARLLLLACRQTLQMLPEIVLHNPLADSRHSQSVQDSRPIYQLIYDNKWATGDGKRQLKTTAVWDYMILYLNGSRQ